MVMKELKNEGMKECGTGLVHVKGLDDNGLKRVCHVPGRRVMNEGIKNRRSA